MIFNTVSQLTLPAALVNERPFGNIVDPTAQQEITRRSFQDSCEPATSPTLASLIDLPNELFYLIITHIPTSDLINLAQQFHHQLRVMNVPAIAFHLLSAVRLFDSVFLTCDLCYFIEYGKELRNLAINGTSVRSVCVKFHRKDQSLLQDPRVTASLLAFLSVVKKSCRILRFDCHFHDLSSRQLSVAATCPPQRLCQIPEWIVLRVLGTFAISADFLRVPSLMATCRGLLQSSQVTHFQLDDCKTQLECDSFLAISKFRSLTSITIRTVHDTPLYIQPDFFMRHTKVNLVSLLAYSIYGGSQTHQTTESLFHFLCLTHLNLTTNHFGRLTCPGRLCHCHLQAPSSHIQPELAEFCSNMNSLVAFVSSFAQHRFKGLELTIDLPDNILDHVAHFQHSGDICSCKDQVHLWAKNCPDVVELHIVHQSTMDDMNLNQIDDFVAQCGNMLSKLIKVQCLAGVWNRLSGFWSRQ
ncbi:hypothetical protein K443DRAFT_135135 [Laccaria amethystina LaAM-08-1]|uniref:Unplaced genomic scaffold K443scaffold_335, whole genome shotgun sequence n=1 Tax=Laccaria amethystina LaAM-08-1 TaxID=1095629 RepID=A0A0C9WPW2_9AGAR|nr:hypothetical protein K443DRAFT_135135 [Laccaria amethystina LaAM-08-1]